MASGLIVKKELLTDFSTFGCWLSAIPLQSLSDSLRLEVPVPRWIGVIFFGIVVLALELLFRYKTYERILKWLCFSILAYVGVAIILRSDVGQALKSVVTPFVDDDKDALLALVAILGTTISPYLFFWQSAEEVEEGRKAPTFYAIIVVGVVAGVAMNLSGPPAIKALFWSAIGNGLAAPPLMFLINKLASSKELMGEHVSGKASKAWLWLGTSLMGAAAVRSLLASIAR